MQHLDTALAWFDPWFQKYGYWFVAVLTFAESFGAPLPAESMLIAASAWCQRGAMSPYVLALVVSCAAFLGDNVGYLIGRFGGRPVVLHLGGWVGLTPERMTKMEQIVHRYGAWMIIVARFIVVLRQLNGVTAGIAHLSWPRFMLANLVGALLWGLFWALAPFYLTGWITHLW